MDSKESDDVNWNELMSQSLASLNIEQNEEKLQVNSFEEYKNTIYLILYQKNLDITNIMIYYNYIKSYESSQILYAQMEEILTHLNFLYWDD